MGSMHRRFSAAFKSKVAFAALRGDRTMAEVAGAFQVHPHQVMSWKVTVRGQKWRNQHKNDGSRQYKPIFRTFSAQRPPISVYFPLFIWFLARERLRLSLLSNRLGRRLFRSQVSCSVPM